MIPKEVEERAREIVENVRNRGDDALREYTKRFESRTLEEIRFSPKEIKDAYESTPLKIREALKAAKKNLERFHKKQIQKSWSISYGGIEAGQRMVPIERVGIYAPGGRYAYPSTVLMCAVPARIAGVKEIALATPSKENAVLAAAHICGITEVYRIGGAQAMAALAFGTESVKRVDKIAGPGNIYVTAAKKILYGQVGIDMPAGPSEVLIIADETANADYIIADMLAQAEHDPLAKSTLVTTSEKLGKEIAERTQNKFEVRTARTIEEAVEIANSAAPEHLEIITKDQKSILKKIRNAGSVFLGAYSPVALGDYATGTNHVLPTGGSARYLSGLGVDSFIKKQTYQQASKKGLARIAKIAETIAECEGMQMHAESIRKRLLEKKWSGK